MKGKGPALSSTCNVNRMSTVSKGARKISAIDMVFIFEYANVGLMDAPDQSIALDMKGFAWDTKCQPSNWQAFLEYTGR